MSSEVLDEELLVDADELRSQPVKSDVDADAASSRSRRPRSPGLLAALAAADAEAAITDAPVEAAEVSDEGSGLSDEESPASSPSSSAEAKKPVKLDSLAVQLPHLPSPFDSSFPASRGGDRWTSLTPDGHCMIHQLEEGEGVTAPVLNRVYSQ
jgi:hypothetical protein